VTKVAQVASWIPGPIGAIASGIAFVGNAVQGNWGAAAMYAASAFTMGAAKYVSAVVSVGKIAGRVGKVARSGSHASAPVKKSNWAK
jgi:hypothetical protein